MKDEKARRRLITRLRRAEGQIAAVRRMVEADAPCVEVLTQIAAARGALGRTGEILLRAHVESCVMQAMESGEPQERLDRVEELMGVFSRYGGLR